MTGVTWESGPKLSTSSPNFVFGNNAQNFNPPNYFDLVLDFIPTDPSSTIFHWYDTSVFTLTGANLNASSFKQLNALKNGNNTTEGAGAFYAAAHINVTSNGDSGKYGGSTGVEFVYDPVPEPASIAMWLTVVVGGAFVARRKSKKAVC